MEYRVKVTRIESGSIITCDLEVPKVCPHCKTSIKPDLLNSYCIKDENIFSTFFCPACEKCFMGHHYRRSLDGKIFKKGIFPYSECTTEFGSSINSLSPNFVSIYNQTEIADSRGLDKIIGLGYRKSLEFLIKDFAIHLCPEKKEQIQKMTLSSCIKEYISENRIKTLAERTAWIGNDETHYIRKHQDKDVSDMKTFIQATVYFIDMTIVTEEASSMTPK